MTRLVPALLVLLVSAPRLYAGPYDDLLKSVPPHTNTLVLVDVKAAFASPLARSEKWSDDFFHRYRAGIGFVPPNAEAAVIASETNLTAMTRDHQIGLVKVRNMPNMRDLAARSGGFTDRLSDQVTAVTPQDVFFVALPNSVLAGIYPANRQAASRWIRFALAGKPAELSAYLKRAVDTSGENTITVAVDLTDSGDAVMLRETLPASPAVVRQKGVDVERVSRFIASVEGLTLSIKIHEGITATVRVDFGLDITPFKRISRELFLEVLDQEGVAVPGMSGWDTTYTERSMTLSGSLTKTDLRRILSLFSFPGPALEEDPMVNPGEVSLPATRRYMGAVDVILADLRQSRDSADFVRMATWNERAAQQLDQLVRRAVDPIAINAAYDTAKRLRALAASLRGVPINLDEIASRAYFIASGGGTSLGWWRGFHPVWNGGGSFSTNFPQIYAEQQKAIADDKKNRSTVWSQIDELLAEARKKLSEKHKTRF
jgi:hypothetical protein